MNIGRIHSINNYFAGFGVSQLDDIPISNTKTLKSALKIFSVDVDESKLPTYGTASPCKLGSIEKLLPKGIKLSEIFAFPEKLNSEIRPGVSH